MSLLPTPSTLRAAAGRLLETALNHVLALDPQSATQLTALEGRRIEVALASPDLRFSATLRDGRIAIGPPDATAETDLSLAGSLGALLARALPGDSPRGIGRVTISGDAELAQRLQKLVQRFDPDIEARFVALFGEIAGVQIARALKQGLDAARDNAKAFARDAADYLTEEGRDVVGRAELAAFCDDVDELRDAVERLERRVGRLTAAG